MSRDTMNLLGRSRGATASRRRSGDARAIRSALAALLSACTFASAAQSQDYPRQLERCGIDPKPRLPPLEAIEGCTAVINSGKASLEITAQAFVNRGDAYRLRHNDIDRALADYDEAIRTMPDFAPALASRGFVYLFARPQLDRAISDFNAAIGIDPASANVFYYRGVAWSGKSDWDRAIADFNEAIRLRATFSIAYRDRGLAKQAKGDKAGGQADLAEAERIGRQGPDCGGAAGCGR
jgi:tetratricopeptide (TPR) repeat protein